MARKSSDAFVDDDDRAVRLPPARLMARPAADETAEDRFAALMRTSGHPDGLSDASRARVLSRLTRRSPAARQGSPVGLRWAIIMAMLLTSGGVIGAVTAHRWWPVRTTVDETPPDRPGTAKPRSRRTRAPVATTEMPAPAPPAEPVALPATATASPASNVVAPAPPATPPAEARPPGPRPKTWPKPSVNLAMAAAPPSPSIVAPPTAAPSGEPTVLSDESRLLGQALARLRQQRDASGALAALDLYQRQFPAGMLHHEADVARADALLMLGRQREALAFLQTLRLQPQGRDQELRVIRGELAAATDCSRAIADFDRLLAQTAPLGLTERALHGRAVCRARQGDAVGATQDLGDYLRRFPAGQFAGEARRNLGQK